MSLHGELAGAAQSLIEAGRRMRAARLVVAREGNLSVRLSDGTILMTPSGADKGSLVASELVHLDAEGRPLMEGMPSSELAMHLAIYDAREDVGAIAHGHPAHATAFAVAGRNLDSTALPETAVAVGRIPLSEYGTPGTPELADAVSALATAHGAILLRNHGAVAFASDLDSAVDRLETVEHLAKILWLAESLGGAQMLDATQLAALDKRFGLPRVSGQP